MSMLQILIQIQLRISRNKTERPDKIWQQYSMHGRKGKYKQARYFVIEWVTEDERRYIEENLKTWKKLPRRKDKEITFKKTNMTIDIQITYFLIIFDR